MKILIKNIILWLLIGSGIFSGADTIITNKKVKKVIITSKSL